MKRIIAAVFVFLLFAAPVFGQMEDMDEHMQDHMGGMMGTTEKKETPGLTEEAEAAGVTVKVTYKNPSDKNPAFDVVLDTHTADLDQYRFEEVTVLRDDSGRVYNATLVSSPGTGHHREASLEFRDADISGAKFVEVAVKGVAGVYERVFKFEIQKEMMK